MVKQVTGVNAIDSAGNGELNDEDYDQASRDLVDLLSYSVGRSSISGPSL